MGVAVTVIPGLIRDSSDEVDTMASTVTRGEDRPGMGVMGSMATDRINDIIEDLVSMGHI